MASNYQPDASAEASDMLYTALLSQRDLAKRVPINYVTAPGIELTPVCFSDNNYQDALAQKCLSNLLSIGFHRFIVDLYWDQSRQTWSLCPVELSTEGNSSSPIRTGSYSTSLSTFSSATSPSASLTLASLSGNSAERRHEKMTTSSVKTGIGEHQWTVDLLYARQTSDVSTAAFITNASLINDAQATGASSTSSPGGSSSTVSQTAASATASGSSHQIGPYSCTTSIGISTLADVLADYFEYSENDLNATFKYLEFNVHSAAPFNDPAGGASTPDPARLPGTGNYISELLNTSLAPYVYTPAALQFERTNLNQSWFSAAKDNQPLAEYFTTAVIPGTTDLYTTDGWPSTSIIMLQRALRFIAGVGTVDPQMQQYNWSADADTIFPAGYISDSIDVDLSSDGTVSSGCLYQSNVTTMSAINSSWAISANLPNMTDVNTTSHAASNLSSCGLSPILNATLNKNLVTTSSSTYITYMREALWGWASNEPSDIDDSDESNNGAFHCAVVNLNNGGHWQVTECSDDHYGACRYDSQPYNWTVSRSRSRYYQVDSVCPDDTTFAVPRTALENTYMQAALTSWVSHQDGDDANTQLFWLNFNDLNILGCWVIGVNSTCPYKATDTNMTRKVVVPTVAGIIVLVLAISTILVKCAANRRNTRRKRKRKRGDDGWDYEGVPS